jgi:hypothetical protein
MKQQFKINYIVICSILLPILLGIFVGFWFLGRPLYALFSGENISTQLTTTLIILIVFWFGLITYLLGTLISALSMVFTDEFIQKGGIKPLKLLWSDITKVSRFGYRVILRSNNRKMEVNLIYFADPDEVVRFIQKWTQINL